MKNVDGIVPVLEKEGERGSQTKRFLYDLAETMVSASGSGLIGTGERMNEDKSRFLADLKSHLLI